MSDGEQKIISFAFETSDHFVKEWRRLDTAIEKAEASIAIAKKAKDHEAAAKAVDELTPLQYEAQDLNLSEARRGLVDNKYSIEKLDSYRLGFAGRLMHLNILLPLESWQRD